MLCSVLALIFCPGNKVCLCKWGWILFWPLHCSCVLEEGSWCGSSGSPHGAVLSSLPPSLLSPSDSEPLHVEETEDQVVPKATLLLFPGSLVQKLAIHMVLNCPPQKKKKKFQSGFVTKLVYFSGKLQLSCWKWFLS